MKSKQCNERKRMRTHVDMSGGVIGLPQRDGFDPYENERPKWLEVHNHLERPHEQPLNKTAKLVKWVYGGPQVVAGPSFQSV